MPLVYPPWPLVEGPQKRWSIVTVVAIGAVSPLVGRAAHRPADLPCISMRAYLDHASTTPLRPAARLAMVEWLERHDGRVHNHGHSARDALRVHEVWSFSFCTWFPNGPEQGKVVLVRVDVEIGEYWDQSGAMKIRALLRRAKSALQGDPESEESARGDLGHGRVHVLHDADGRGA